MTATIETSETMTAREIAKAIRVGTRTRKFEMRDRDGYTVMGQYGVPRYARVLNSLMRSGGIERSASGHSDYPDKYALRCAFLALGEEG